MIKIALAVPPDDGPTGVVVAQVNDVGVGLPDDDISRLRLQVDGQDEEKYRQLGFHK